MTISETFAVISEYKKIFSKTVIQLHTVVLSDRYKELPKIYPYRILKPEVIPYKELKTFLESAIPENCEVYASDGYYKKYSAIIKELEQKYVFNRIKRMCDAPEEIQGELVLCFARANNDRDKNIKNHIKKHIDAMFERENIKKQYINNVVQNA